MTTTELPHREHIDGLDRRRLQVTVRQEPTPSRQSVITGPAERIFVAGGDGLPWRVRQSVVRLDSISPAGHPTFASLAIAGDILGCEALLLGAYALRFPAALAS